MRRLRSEVKRSATRWTRWFLPTMVFAPLLAFTPAARAIPLNDWGNGSACPYLTFGNANMYSLSLLTQLYNAYQGGGTGPGNPFYVNSTPGQIKNLIVIATGAGGLTLAKRHIRRARPRRNRSLRTSTSYRSSAARCTNCSYAAPSQARRRQLGAYHA